MFLIGPPSLLDSQTHVVHDYVLSQIPAQCLLEIKCYINVYQTNECLTR